MKRWRINQTISKRIFSYFSDILKQKISILQIFSKNESKIRNYQTDKLSKQSQYRLVVDGKNKRHDNRFSKEAVNLIYLSFFDLAKIPTKIFIKN